MEIKSAAICLLPGPGGRCESNASKLTLNPLNRKTRICNQWESTGCCAYGKNCHFAHGHAGMNSLSIQMLGQCNSYSAVILVAVIGVSLLIVYIIALYLFMLSLILLYTFQPSG